MILHHNTLCKLETWLQSKSDDALVTYLALIKAIFSILGFVALVVLWDTLPSVSPVTLTDTKTWYNAHTHNLSLSERYQVSKAVEFEIRRELVHGPVRILINALGSRVDPNTLEEKATVSVELTPGPWCVERSISWSNGLSLRQHHRTLPAYCFLVGDDGSILKKY